MSTDKCKSCLNNKSDANSDSVKIEDINKKYPTQMVLHKRDEELADLSRLPRKDEKSTRHTEPGNFEASLCRDISVKKSTDRGHVAVRGVLAVGDKILILDNDNNEKLKLFSASGVFLSSTDLKTDTRGITLVNADTFATCGHDYRVFIWKIQGQTLTCGITYPVKYFAHGIHYNHTFYCVLHKLQNAITLLDRQGRLVGNIAIGEACGKQITFGLDIYMDEESHTMYVTCDDPSSGVLCVSVEGQVLWFTPMSGVLWGITEIGGVLCVADSWDRCLYLISKSGVCERELLEKSYVNGEPWYLFYDRQGKTLYVTYSAFEDKRDLISMYSVTS